MPKKGLTAVKVTFMTMTLVTPVTAVKFDYGTVQYCTALPAQEFSYAVDNVLWVGKLWPRECSTPEISSVT